MRNRLFLIAMVVAGCKGETVVKPDPNTQSELDRCKKELAEADAYKKKLESDNTELMTKSKQFEVVLTVQGDIVKPIHATTGTGAPPPNIDPKLLAAAEKDFENLVEKSRGSIQKCYEQALKKNTGLQARSVTLTVVASFTPSGSYQNSSFAPSLDDTFTSCMQNIASHWQLKETSPAMTFKAQISLTPS